MKQMVVFEAEDGQRFETEEECREHEERGRTAMLLGLAEVDLIQAENGENAPLGEAFERFGTRCSTARIARGGSKRKRAAA